jgi:hypothetical protein
MLQVGPVAGEPELPAGLQPGDRLEENCTPLRSTMRVTTSTLRPASPASGGGGLKG